MSGGKFHARVAGAALWPLLIVALIMGIADPLIGAGIATGAISGLLVTPDIDLPTRTYEERRVYAYRHWLGIVWQSFWSPYSLVMGHRGVSHWHLVGTVTRMGYFLVAAYILFNYVGVGMYNDACITFSSCRDVYPATLDIVAQIVQATAQFWVFWYVAWAIQDELHIITDWGYSTKKRMRRAGKRPMSQFRRFVALGVAGYAMWYFFIK